MNKIEELSKLEDLVKSGSISREEFNRLKSEVINRSVPLVSSSSIIHDITGGAANKMVRLEWVKLIIIILILVAAAFWALYLYASVCSTSPLIPR